MIQVFIRFFIGKAQHFYKVLPADFAFTFYSSCIGSITYIANGYDAIVVHFFFSFYNFSLNKIRRKISFSYNRTKKFNQSGMWRYYVFQMTELQMAVAVDKAGADDAIVLLNIFSGFSFNYEIGKTSILM